MISTFFEKPGVRSRSAAGAAMWPRDRIEAGIAKRFQGVQGPHLRDDYVLYGITDGAVAFAIVLHHPTGRPKDIDQIIFYTRFEGFSIDETRAGAMNRNLHIAAVQVRDGALDMFAGVEPNDAFTDAALNASFDSWKRDLAIVVGMLTSGASYATEFGLDRDQDIARLAVNTADAEGRSAQAMFSSLFGGARERAICNACEGRGKTGFIARACDQCAGSGIIEKMRRR